MEPTTVLPTGLNDLDYAVLGILFLSGILAMFRGFVRETFSLISWTAAYFVAAKYHDLVTPWVHNYIKNDQAASLAAAIGLFIITLIALTVIGNAVADAIRGQGLTAIDRSLGFIFGLFRGALVVCIVYLAAVAIWWPELNKPPVDQTSKDKPPEWLMDAKTRPAMARGAAMLEQFVPQKDLEKAAATIQEKKAEAQHEMDQKALDKLSTPTIPDNKDVPPPTYDEKARDNLNQLIEQKSKP